MRVVLSFNLDPNQDYDDKLEEEKKLKRCLQSDEVIYALCSVFEHLKQAEEGMDDVLVRKIKQSVKDIIKLNRKLGIHGLNKEDLLIAETASHIRSLIHECFAGLDLEY